MNFKHDYDKLERDVFPTVRSKGYMKKHGIGIESFNYHGECCDEVKTPTKTFTAQLIAFEDEPIQHMPLSFLKYDAAPIPINSHQDFVDLLNSFIPQGNPHKLTTVKRILWWKKV